VGIQSLLYSSQVCKSVWKGKRSALDGENEGNLALRLYTAVNCLQEGRKLGKSSNVTHLGSELLAPPRGKPHAAGGSS
jgi:hypothetical protein